MGSGAPPQKQGGRGRYRLKQALSALGVRRQLARVEAVLEQTVAELARAQGETAQARDEAVAARDVVARARARVVEARAAERELRRAAELRADQALAEAAGMQAGLELAREDAADLRLARDRMLASTSWRLTAPLRRVMQAVPGPARRVARAGLALVRRAGLARQTPTVGMPDVQPVAAQPPEAEGYAAWIAANEPAVFVQVGARPRPVLALLLPAPGPGLAATLAGLLGQEGAEWTLFAPDTPEVRDATEALRHDRRLMLVPCAPELDRGGVLAALLNQVDGAWFLVLDPGEVPAPGAMAMLAGAAATDPDAALIYADEDQLGPDGRRESPRFKPGWSPELLLSCNYVGRPALLSRAAVAAAGGFRSETGAAAEWDLLLRLGTTRAVQHVPAVLWHRAAGGRTDRLEAGSPAAEAHRAVLLDHLVQLGGKDATAVLLEDGSFRSRWRAAEPLPVSVIVAGCGDPDALRRCLAWVREATDYPRRELIVAETGSADPGIVALMAELRLVAGVRLAGCAGPRSVFAALDHGAGLAEGPLLQFLGAGGVSSDPFWLQELARVAGLEGVGAAGPGAGVADAAELAWDGMLCRRAAFNQAGGFGDGGGARDALLCRRLAALGWRVAATPHTGLAPRPVAAEGGDPDPQFLLFDDAAVLDAAGLPRRFVIPDVAAERPIRDAWAAARWVVALLRARADLRARFPRAVSDGAGGAFAAFLAGDPELPVPAGLRAQLAGMWAADVSARPRQVYAWRDDVRAAHPAGLLPPGMGGFLRYLVRSGVEEYGLRLEETWWLLLAAAERPSLELVTAYRFNREWQGLHPAALTAEGAPGFAAWVARRYGTGGSTTWLDPATWPGTEPPAATQGGAAVNVIGHFCYPSGLRVSVEAVTAAMEVAGVTVHRRDVRTHLEDCADHMRFGGLELADTTLLHIQPGELLSLAYERADLVPREPRTHRIGYWYWELETVPPDWAEAAREMDELWVATEFIAGGLRPVSGAPVHVLFPGVRLGAFTPRPRETLGAPARGEGRFAFLFSFHMASIMQRKNPFGLIRAFRRAFGPEDPVDLVLKTTSEPRHAGQMAALRAAAEGANVTVLDAVLGPEDTLALMDGCDAYVSLHRSEGLGLTMAEAMLLGKPVVATRYSGNLAFMDDGNSLLVDAVMVPVGPGVPPYDPAALWAEPSEEQAARLMRRLVADRAAAAALGRAARRSAEARLCLETAGRAMAARLEEIRVGRVRATKAP